MQINRNENKASRDIEPQMNTDEHRFNETTEKIIGCAYRVGNTLGVGFLEKVYENALKIELTNEGFKVVQQYPIKVTYDGQLVGEFVADLLVDEEVIVEIKAVNRWDDIFMAQCLNYLRATGLEACLLINFGKPRVEIKRIINT